MVQEKEQESGLLQSPETQPLLRVAGSGLCSVNGAVTHRIHPMSQQHIEEMLCSPPPPFSTLPSHPNFPGFGRWHTNHNGMCCRGWESCGDDCCQLTLAIQSFTALLNLLQKEDLSSNLC